MFKLFLLKVANVAFGIFLQPMKPQQSIKQFFQPIKPQQGFVRYIVSSTGSGISHSVDLPVIKPYLYYFICFLDIEKHDGEGRVITAEYADYYLVTVCKCIFILFYFSINFTRMVLKEFHECMSGCAIVGLF